MLFVYHVFCRATDTPDVAPHCSHTFEGCDWTHTASHTTIEGARAAAFAVMAMHVRAGYCLGGNAQVRVYAEGALMDAAEHADRHADEESMEWHWKETAKPLPKDGKCLGGFEFQGHYEAAKF